MRTQRSRNSTTQAMTFNSLPFVYWPDIETDDDKRSNWDVTPTDDYNQVCQDGSIYAANLAQFLKENPQWVSSNNLCSIVAHMDFSDTSPPKGYYVEFFEHLEHLIYGQAQRMDVFSDVKRVNSVYAKLVENRIDED